MGVVGTIQVPVISSEAYSAAFSECSEPSIATIIFENFECDAAASDEDNLIL